MMQLSLSSLSSIKSLYNIPKTAKIVLNTLLLKDGVNVTFRKVWPSR